MTITVRAKVEGALALSPDFGEAGARIMEAFAHAFEIGTANGEIDKVFVDSFSIAASTTTDWDLKGSLLDIFGLAFTPAEVAAVIVYADAANVNNVIVGGDANAVPIFGDPTDTIAVRPGSLFVITAGAAGITVTTGTGDIVQLANSSSGAAVTGKLIILARSS